MDSYEANAWLNSLSTDADGVTLSRVANHSWVGNGSDPVDLVDHSGDTLHLVDRMVQRGESIQVVAINNGSGNQPLLGSAYNVIAVGRTDGNHAKGSYALSNDTAYVGGRTRPDIVAPQGSTSAATPVVAAAAALLVQTGHRGSTRLSKGSTTLSGIGTIYNAERSETIKAALMAGADRHTRNTSISANITDYRSTGYKASNGLDRRYGAGQVNIWNSYRIIAAGEHNSRQDGGSGIIGMSGFDYDGVFGGPKGSNRMASYFFTVHSRKVLSASLAWNLWVPDNRSVTATLPDLNLVLFDRSAGSIDTLARSNSTRDKTENLWVQLVGGHRYELRVTTSGSLSSPCDYALAWNIGK
ncbi:MAG: hypothetical protein MZV65_00670 [Chromatiales bacterium]|nr:hypothetical protein [Chromatiales bacterium]